MKRSTTIALVIAAFFLAMERPQSALGEPRKGEDIVMECDSGGSMRFWLNTSLRRIYQADEPSGGDSLHLLAARNGRFSFQTSAANRQPVEQGVDCEVVGAHGLDVSVRRVGYVPMRHHTTEVDVDELEGYGRIPGMVPEPLFPEARARIGPWENQTFWITVAVPEGATPGSRKLTVRMTPWGGAESAELTGALEGGHPEINVGFPSTTG